MVKKNPLEEQAKQTLLKYLRDVPFLQTEPLASKPRREQGQSPQPDALIKLKYPHHEQLLVVEARSSGQPKTAREAINQLHRYLEQIPGGYGVLFAPYISPQTAAICRAEGIGYADLAGNCYLSFPHVYIRREDWPNPIKQKRELRSLYSPKASRVLRVLLVTAGEGRRWRVAALADEAGVSLGQVSNVKKRLADREWIQSDSQGFWLSEPQALLEEWSENYTRRRHVAHDFYSLKSVADVEAELADVCERNHIRYAFTGFSAAARLAPSVRHQRAMAYVQDQVELLTRKLDLKKVESGANLTLYEPTDDSIFYGAQTAPGGARLVSPIQAYLDLKGYRGRGEEAAEAVFQQVIQPKWQ